MNEKWGIVFEYDLDKGLCILAKKNAGAGEVALFDSQEEAQEWVESSEDIDAELWNINYIKITDF